jgi:hypothetical protein
MKMKEQAKKHIIDTNDHKMYPGKLEIEENLARR